MLFDRKILAMQTGEGSIKILIPYLIRLGLPPCFMSSCTPTKWFCREEIPPHCGSWVIFIITCLYAFEILGWSFSHSCLFDQQGSSQSHSKFHSFKMLVWARQWWPDYSFLRVFACACWPNLHPYNSHRLEFPLKDMFFPWLQLSS